MTPTPREEKIEERIRLVADAWSVKKPEHLDVIMVLKMLANAAFRDGEDSMRERAIKEIPSFRRDDFLIGPNVIVGKHTNLEIVFKALKKYIGALPSAQKEEGRE